MAGARQRSLEAQRRQAQRVGLAGFLGAAALPVVLFHDVMAIVARDFRIDPGYLAGWLPWALMAGGLVFLVPVVLSAGRPPDDRLYPLGRNAYAGWGVTLYLLGFLLAFQVARITEGGVAG